MLEQEDQVEDHSDHGEEELHYVEAGAGPREIYHWFVIIPVIKTLLSEREESSTEIEEYVRQRPSDSRLPLPVKVDLWHVLDESDQCLAVSAHPDSCIVLP